jgi:hypothetical protein
MVGKTKRTNISKEQIESADDLSSDSSEDNDMTSNEYEDTYNTVNGNGKKTPINKKDHFFKLNLFCFEISSSEIIRANQKCFEYFENYDIFNVISSLFVSFIFFIMFKLIDFIIRIYLNNKDNF